MGRTINGISIDYTYYIFSHGRAPRGRGRWAFYLGRGYEGEPRFYDGTFGEACRCAVRDARAAGVATITVGS